MVVVVFVVVVINVVEVIIVVVIVVVSDRRLLIAKERHQEQQSKCVRPMATHHTWSLLGENFWLKHQVHQVNRSFGDTNLG